MPLFTQGFFVGGVVLFTLTAAISDIRTRRLPNRLTVPALGAGLAFHAVTGGWAGLGTAAGGFALGFGILFVLWLIGGGGGGDVKLMGALGAWLGPMDTLLVFFLSAVLAVAATMLLAATDLVGQGYHRTRGKYLPAAVMAAGRAPRTAEAARLERHKRRVLPYAAPVALATWLLLAWRLVQG